MNPHQAHPTSLVAMVSSVLRNRGLIEQLTRRDVVGRYRGSVIGLAWSFLSPLIMLAIYTFVFSVVFQTRWGGSADESRSGFALVLFAGLIVHGLFAECVNRAPGVILANANLVKKVVFPLEILPWVSMGSAGFHTLASLAALLVAQLAIHHTLPWTVLLLPLVLAPLLLATMGVSWLLAALGVFVRDISQMTGMLTSVLLFLSPVFYPVSALPETYRPWLYLNPLTAIIEDTRNVLIFGRLPAFDRLLVAFVVSVCVAQLGFWFFQRTRRGFADVV
jgi:lipopolysaccharide transport system permease protein